ncbi:MAG TPA: hypothetical protein VG871_23470 [Vicinamibacterales bacterium]|nr:hypothetical protein [Vicinamibacterales bacterium]
MKTYAVLGVVLALTAATAAPAAAQRIEVTPFVGWETAGSYPLPDSTTTQALQADAQATYGFAFDYDIMRNVEAEFLWATNPTTYSAQSAATGAFTQAYKSRIDQYQFGALYLWGDNATPLRPYMVVSMGFTHDGNGDAAPGRSAIAFGAGGGIKYAFSHHVGFRGEARWIPTYGNSSLGTFCDFGGDLGYGYDPYGYGGYGGGCYQDTVHNFLQRFNFTVGLTIRP